MTNNNASSNYLPFPVQMRPEEMVQEIADMSRKAIDGLDTVSQLTEADVQIGPTPKEEVYRDGKMVLYRYKSFVENPFEIPVLVVYALVNRPYMVDLQENRSMIRNLLSLGLDVYIVDWGYPTRMDRWLTLEDYIEGYMNDCVDYIRNAHGLDKINLLGICQAGVFSLMYTALYQEKIKNLITMVVPIDFHADGSLLNTWTGCTIGQPMMEPDLMADGLGIIPGDFMNFGFLMLKPFELNLQKYLGFLDIADDIEKTKNFLRMEKWIFDSPDLAGECYRKFLGMFVRNALMNDDIELGGREVHLKDITIPILSLFAEKDHLVPPASTRQLRNLVSSEDFTEKSFPVGHIGMYVSGKVQRDLGPAVNDWLRARA